MERKPKNIFNTPPEKAKELLTDYVWKKMDQSVDAYIQLRYLLLTKYTNNKQGINF